jgi:SnoaL-like domain
MTKTHSENTPSDALTAWRKAFFTKDAEAFAEGFAENVVLEGSALRKPVEGRDRVRQLLWTAAEIYESLVFTDQASSGQRTYIEWVATAFGGKQLRGSTILVTNEEGKIDHAVVQHRPLDGLLAFSAELGKRMSGVEDSDSFWKEYER